MMRFASGDRGGGFANCLLTALHAKSTIFVSGLSGISCSVLALAMDAAYFALSSAIDPDETYAVAWIRIPCARSFPGTIISIKGDSFVNVIFSRALEGAAPTGFNADDQ